MLRIWKGVDKMDFEPMTGTEEVRREFEDFFREVMENAPPGWEGSAEDLATPEGWAFHLRVARELGKRGWLSLADVVDHVSFAQTILGHLPRFLLLYLYGKHKSQSPDIAYAL